MCDPRFVPLCAAGFAPGFAVVGKEQLSHRRVFQSSQATSVGLSIGPNTTAGDERTSDGLEFSAAEMDSVTRRSWFWAGFATRS